MKDTRAIRNVNSRKRNKFVKKVNINSHQESADFAIFGDKKIVHEFDVGANFGTELDQFREAVRVRRFNEKQNMKEAARNYDDSLNKARISQKDKARISKMDLPFFEKQIIIDKLQASPNARLGPKGGVFHVKQIKNTKDRLDAFGKELREDEHINYLDMRSLKATLDKMDLVPSVKKTIIKTPGRFAKMHLIKVAEQNPRVKVHNDRLNAWKQDMALKYDLTPQEMALPMSQFKKLLKFPQSQSSSGSDYDFDVEHDFSDLIEAYQKAFVMDYEEQLIIELKCYLKVYGNSGVLFSWYDDLITKIMACGTPKTPAQHAVVIFFLPYAQSESQSFADLFSLPRKITDTMETITNFVDKPATDAFNGLHQTTMEVQAIINSVKSSFEAGNYLEAGTTTLFGSIGYIIDFFLGPLSKFTMPTVYLILTVTEQYVELTPAMKFLKGFAGIKSTINFACALAQSDVLNGLAKAFLSGFNLCTDYPVVTKLTKILSSLGSAFRGVDGILNAMKEIFNFIIGLFPSFVAMCGFTEPDYVEFKQSIQSFLDDIDTGNTYYTSSTIAHLRSVIIKGNKLATALSANGKNVLANDCLKLVDKLGKCYTKILGTIKGNTFRPEPVCVGFFGKPGCGKTRTCDFIKSNYINRHYPDMSEDSTLYYSRTLSPYWEGVNFNTKVISFDDFAQMRDTPGAATSHYHDIINIVNCHPFYPNMAFDSKGTMVLEPELILLSSNLNAINPLSINSAKAVTRRIHMSFIVTLVEGEALEVHTSRWRYELAVFDERNELKGTSKFYTYDQVLELIEEKKALLDNVHTEFVKRMQESEMRSLTMEDLFSEEETESNFDSDSEPSSSTVTPHVWERTKGEYIDSHIVVPSWVPSPIVSKAQDAIFEYLRANSHMYEAYKKLPINKRVMISNKCLEGMDFRLDEEIAPIMRGFNQISETLRCPYVKNFVKALALVGSSAAIIGTLYTLLDYVMGTVIPESTMPKQNFGTVDKGKLIPNPLSQSGKQKNFDDICSVIKSNVRTIFVQANNERKKIGNALGIKNHFAIIPYHYVYDVADFIKTSNLTEEEVDIIISDNTEESIVPCLTFFSFVQGHFEDKDIIVARVPNHFRDIIKHFPTANELVNYKAGNVFFDGALLTDVIHHFCSSTFLASQCVVGAKTYRAHDVARYTLYTKKGDCGNPVIMEVPTPRVVALHIAGFAARKCGYGAIITQEFLQCIFGDYVRVPQSDNQYLEELDDYVVPQGLYSVGVIPQSSVVANNNIIHSEGLPYKNRCTEVINPSKENYDKVLCKYLAKTDVTAKESDLSLVRSVVFKDLTEAIGLSHRRVYTLGEAVFGIPGSNFRSIDSSSSPGYPYSVKGIRKSRFIKDGMPTPNFPELRNEIQRVYNLLREDSVPPLLFTDSLKMEKLPIEKVKNGKVRLVSACPLVLTILTRKFFGGFCHSINDHPIDSNTAIGLNPYSKDWTYLAQRLNEVAGGPQNYGAGDYSGFDASLVQPLLNQVLEGILEWYDDPENEMIRRNLWTYLTRSYHVRGDVLRVWVKSLPSGHPLTTIANSLANLIALRYAWFVLTERDINLLLSMKKHVYVCVLGDDNIFSVSHDYQHIFTEAEVGRVLTQLGLKYTSDDKLTTNSALRDMSDITFLKRSFRQYGKFYLAPLELDVVLETPLWTRKKDSVSITLTNLRFAMRELSLHGKEVFDEWADKLVSFCPKPGWITKSYDLYLLECLSQDYYY